MGGLLGQVWGGPTLGNRGGILGQEVGGVKHRAFGDFRIWFGKKEGPDLAQNRGWPTWPTIEGSHLGN